MLFELIFELFHEESPPDLKFHETNSRRALNDMLELDLNQIKG